MQKLIVYTLTFMVLFASCITEPKTNDEPTTLKKSPTFNADNAFKHIESQVAFGPRVPGSAAQKQCAAFIQNEIEKYCDTVYIQNTTVTQPL